MIIHKPNPVIRRMRTYLSPVVTAVGDHVRKTAKPSEYRVPMEISREIRKPGYSPLIDYALAGLDRCWLPEYGRWSHIYHLDGRETPNESVPHSDVFYTLNVLLGISRLNTVPAHLDVSAIFQRNALLLTQIPVSEYAFGMALWAGAELGLPIPENIRSHVDLLLADESRWLNLRAQDVGMMLMGIIAQAKFGNYEWSGAADRLFSFLVFRHRSQSGLFFDTYAGFKRRFGTFATQVYLTMACYHYGEFTGNGSAIGMANECASALIAMQGPRGEWPWFFDARRGTVLDFYEVYSVHQYGMAPALLEQAEQHDVGGARDALVKGFYWVLGENQLGISMLVPELQLSIRSQVRTKEIDTRSMRAVRAVRNAWIHRSASWERFTALSLRQECRSYELGWILWSFGARSNLTELTHNSAFTAHAHGERKNGHQLRGPAGGHS